MRKISITIVLWTMVAVCGPVARGDVDMQYVPVGDPGNVSDDTGFGGVDYEYYIGKYEVTAGQYAEFLNAVATVGDPHGLYNPEMWSYEYGCKINRSGVAGSYEYSVAADRANRPVNFVSFWDACRFANWLHNGQPEGVQDLTTTEDGAYFLNGVTSPDNEDISREPDAKVWIPNQDEWYKAAYYKGGGTDAGYWDYPTQSDNVPKHELPPGTDPVNGSANYYPPLGDTYYSTEVGAYIFSASPYGTFDQGGNAYERCEDITYGANRATLGGSFLHVSNTMAAVFPSTHSAADEPVTTETECIGFRVASVPTPGAALLGVVGLGMVAWFKKRRAA